MVQLRRHPQLPHDCMKTSGRRRQAKFDSYKPVSGVIETESVALASGIPQLSTASCCSPRTNGPAARQRSLLGILVIIQRRRAVPSCLSVRPVCMSVCLCVGSFDAKYRGN